MEQLADNIGPVLRVSRWPRHQSKLTFCLHGPSKQQP